ncbi:MAG TPA: glycosyl hydrolase family 18 protein [Polyangiaceae bacterium]|nr:glycosyl hydrolase family 18 protein [Polyangiaceae bacterium]
MSSVGGTGASGGMSGSAGAAQAGSGGMGNPNPPGKQSLIWIWEDYKNSLDKVVQHKSSFTHVSPAFYQLNESTTPKLLNDPNDDFDGLSSKAFADAVHAAGLKVQPLMYAGAGNGGTDQYIQSILSDSDTQKNFIDSMVTESVAKGYDGVNLDWEVQGTNFDQYGTKLITFLTAFTAAMHQHNMTVTFDLGGWYTRQCGDNNALVDLTKVGNSVDQMIMEDYSGTFGGPATSCPATNPGSVSCDQSYVKELDVMCNLSKSVVNIGLISPENGNGGTNPFAVDALNAVDSYGFTAVSLWPDDGNFINSNNVQNGSDWYTVLAAWLAKK